jgi:hypothetical protein
LKAAKKKCVVCKRDGGELVVIDNVRCVVCAECENDMFRRPVAVAKTLEKARKGAA